MSLMSLLTAENVVVINTPAQAKLYNKIMVVKIIGQLMLLALVVWLSWY